MSKSNNQEKAKPVNQAEELKHLFEEIEAEQSKHLNMDKEEIKIDVLDLPPRSKVHVSNQKLLRIPINKSLLRFVFVLIVISVLVYYVITNDHINLF